MAGRAFSVCVFCGARDGDSPAHGRAARALGQAIARHGWRLVYGAGDVGLMGEVARAARAGGGETLGVIPVHLMARETARRDTRGLVVTETMHERKKVMFMNSDAIVVLPGGAGSLDEFFEVLTWHQIGLHEKPLLLLNSEGYWDKLLELLEHIVEQGFADEELRRYVQPVASVAQLCERLLAARSSATA